MSDQHRQGGGQKLETPIGQGIVEIVAQLRLGADAGVGPARGEARVSRPIGLDLEAADNQRAAGREGQHLERRVIAARLARPVGDVAAEADGPPRAAPFMGHRRREGAADGDEHGGMGEAQPLQPAIGNFTGGEFGV